MHVNRELDFWKFLFEQIDILFREIDQYFGEGGELQIEEHNYLS